MPVDVKRIFQDDSWPNAACLQRWKLALIGEAFCMLWRLETTFLKIRSGGCAGLLGSGFANREQSKIARSFQVGRFGPNTGRVHLQGGIPSWSGCVGETWVSLMRQQNVSSAHRTGRSSAHCEFCFLHHLWCAVRYRPGVAMSLVSPMSVTSSTVGSSRECGAVERRCKT